MHAWLSLSSKPLPFHLIWQGAGPVTPLPQEFSQAIPCSSVNTMGLEVGKKPCIFCVLGPMVYDTLSCEFRGCLTSHQCILEPVCP